MILEKYREGLDVRLEEGVYKRCIQEDFILPCGVGLGHLSEPLLDVNVLVSGAVLALLDHAAAGVHANSSAMILGISCFLHMLRYVCK